MSEEKKEEWKIAICVVLLIGGVFGLTLLGHYVGFKDGREDVLLEQAAAAATGDLRAEPDVPIVISTPPSRDIPKKALFKITRAYISIYGVCEGGRFECTYLGHSNNIDCNYWSHDSGMSLGVKRAGPTSAAEMLKNTDIPNTMFEVLDEYFKIHKPKEELDNVE